MVSDRFFPASLKGKWAAALNRNIFGTEPADRRESMEIYGSLKKYFGFDKFVTGQEKLIRGILEGRDALGIMPTGGGKSLCYQLPATLLPGVTVVISPLISLMKDQVDALDEMGLPGTCINSTLEDDELYIRLRDIRANKYKIIYVAPERLNTGLFINLARDLDISLVAIDEAHCISQWGHDFRPSYLSIPGFIDALGKRPAVAAFTATATGEVIEEIKFLLGLKNPLEVLTGFDRPNLFYRVVKHHNKLAYLVDYLRENHKDESGIIYCATRKTVEALTAKFNAKGFSAVGYHGGMNPEQRQKNQDDFMLDRVRIIAATNAFGMGIDKPDVRFVIHYNMPKNMEAYYQEAGRAGRDGERSDCILMFSPSDIVKQKIIMEQDILSPERKEVLYRNLQYLIDYCHTNDCLRNKILAYFGEEIKNLKCGNCGNCLDESEMADITVEAQKILSCIYRVNQSYGVNTITRVLKGSKEKKLLEWGLDEVSTYGIMQDYSADTIKEIVMTMASQGYVHITADKFPILRLNQKSWAILKGEDKIYHKKDMLYRVSEKQAAEQEDLPFDTELYERLRQLRQTLAVNRSLPSYVIFHDATLKGMAAYFPENEEEFLRIKGVGQKKFESYGNEFAKVIKDYIEEKGIDTKTVQKNTLTAPAKPTPQNDGPSRYEDTFSCYMEGLTLQEMAQKRGLTVATIINHLERCQKDGKCVDLTRFVEPAKARMILEAVKRLGTGRLKPIKEALSEDISYDEIRLAIALSTDP